MDEIVASGIAVNGQSIAGIAQNGVVLWQKESAVTYIAFRSDTEFTLQPANASQNWDGTLYCSTDATDWIAWDGTSAAASSNGVLYLRGTSNTKITGMASTYRWSFVGATNLICQGNAENLLDWETVANGGHPEMASYCFAFMFYGCTSITTPPELPATSLTPYCYQGMFRGCSALLTAPTLPATTLQTYCYQYLFYGCTALTAAPLLPATTMANYCYSYMFRGCAALLAVPELPATILANYCYYYMFYGCSSITTPPELPATSLTPSCYGHMLRSCTSLTAVPALPATTLQTYCYYYMLSGCSNIAISETQTEACPYPWSIPSSGTIYSTATSWSTNMISTTGGTFTGAPSINTTYYTTNQPVGQTVSVTYSAEVTMFGITPADTASENVEILEEMGVSV